MSKQKNDDNKINEEQVEEQSSASTGSAPKLVSAEEFEKLQTEFSSLQELTTRLDGQLKRAVADYQNLEKRVEQGRSELSSWAATNLITKILPVLSHLEKVINLGRPVLSEKSESKDWFRGVELAVQQLHQVLKDEGLEEIQIDPSTPLRTGSQFDPSLHEAVDTREGEQDKVLEVVEKGYNLGGKVIKPAKVVVGRSSSS